MKATAFAPGHITGFFEPVYYPDDFSRSGSKGAGINLTLGATSEVTIEESRNQIFEIYINDKKSKAPVTDLALKYLLGKTSLKVIVNTKLDLPIGQGFGMSAAGALSATLAATKLTNLTRNDAIKASHFAEIQLRSGLGDVIASCFGGLEIRKSAGLPPWGIIEHIPYQSDIILCVIDKKINTKNILYNQDIMKDIIEYGNYCTKKILETPSIENFFDLSLQFTKKINISTKIVTDALNQVNNFGKASMCMLGNSIISVGDINALSNILTKFGNIYLCNVDEFGAQIID
jgi:pantoate kinase